MLSAMRNVCWSLPLLNVCSRLGYVASDVTSCSLVSLHSRRQIHYYNKKIKNKNVVVDDGGKSMIVKWRKMNRLEVNPNKYGPLTNLADYTYINSSSRVTSLGVNQCKRIIKQRDIARAVIDGLHELESGVDRQMELERAAVESRRATLDNRLKHKGHMLMKSKHIT